MLPFQVLVPCNPQKQHRQRSAGTTCPLICATAAIQNTQALSNVTACLCQCNYISESARLTKLRCLAVLEPVRQSGRTHVTSLGTTTYQVTTSTAHSTYLNILDSVQSPTIKEMMSFFSLPRELRDQIYGYALVDDNFIDVVSYRRWPYGKSLSPNLLLTNNTVYNEAIGMLYGANKFSFLASNASNELVQFLNQIGRANARLIRHIRMGFPRYYRGGDSEKECEMEKSDAKSLEMLMEWCGGTLRTIRMVLTTVRIDGWPRLWGLNSVVLDTFDAHFKGFIVELDQHLDEGEARHHLLNEMQRRGWILEVASRRGNCDMDGHENDNDDRATMGFADVRAKMCNPFLR